uniref:Reverse transcriptase domain, reverse transcriptase zinc-binding domain protein n=1 Tax=Tanacetum cinerariifolium TaxID=118510 RepID=A0A6L2LRE5_TANCI|nr:hypothetical protein [Tanacetum cinerariifolium]
MYCGIKSLIIIRGWQRLPFECNYSSHVWNSVKVLTGKSNIPNELDLIVDSMITKDAAKSFSTTASKLLFAASCYFIWQERNSRLFKKTKRTHDQLVTTLKYTVRLKLLTCSFVWNSKDQELVDIWKLPLIGIRAPN